MLSLLLLIPGSFAVMQELFRSSMCQEVANVLKIEYLIGLTRASRKVEEGKNKMSVLNAVRAKLVTIMFAVIRTDAFFSRNYQNSLA